MPIFSWFEICGANVYNVIIGDLSKRRTPVAGGEIQGVPTANFDAMIEIPLEHWDSTPEPRWQAAAIAAIECGRVVRLPQLAFALAPEERGILSNDLLDKKAKNISFDWRTETLSGAHGATADLAVLNRMIGRFARHARSLVSRLFPSYARAVVVARTSFRPIPAENRESSWRKDDSRLHVDAFPSRPLRGQRILRVFTNVNPLGEPRMWRIGESFEDVAARFLPSIRLPLPGTARMLAALRITKGVRSPYDHIMLQLHDRMKADAAYQANAESSEVAFPSGTTWVCFSDQVSHAVMRGQYMLEQTLYLPLAAMNAPETSPLRVLERLAGRTLA